MPGSTPTTIDAIIVATSTPDLTFPSARRWCRRALGMTRGFAFDVQAVCAGFVFALANANALIVSGQAQRVLVIGAETFSRLMDWTDRVDLRPVRRRRGRAGAGSGRGRGHRRRPGHPVRRPAFGRALQGPPLCRWRRLDRHHRPSADAGQGSLPPCRRKAGRNRPHRAGQGRADRRGRRLDRAASGQPAHHHGTAQRMQVPMDRVVVTVQDHGNTSAASIPLRCRSAGSAGRSSRGDLVVTEAIGGGLAWGSVVLRW